MKHIVIATALVMLFGLSAFAQSGDPQSRAQGTSLSAKAAATAAQALPSQAPKMSTSANQFSPNQTPGEKKLKGCLRSERGKYVLEAENGERVPITSSENLAAQVGQIVTVHGAYTDSGTSTRTETAAGASAMNEQFMVSKIDTTSQTCKEPNTDNGGKPSPYRY